MKINSISFKVLTSLILLSVSILILLGIFEVYYFQYSYEKYQIKNIHQLAENINSLNIPNLNQSLEQLAYKNEVCIEAFWKNNTVTQYNTMLNGCGLGKNNTEIDKAIETFILSNINEQAYKIENKEYKTKAYLYGVKTNFGTIFLYSALEDISEVSVVLKNQYLYMIVIGIIVACLLSYFLSLKLTKPILDITKRARKLGKENQNVEFPKYDIIEIDELANVLNSAQMSMEKTEELRRDLLANVSHDLKTPLTMIKAYSEMVRDISYADDEKRNFHCNVIINETERLNLLVNDILSLSKMQANAEVLNKEKFDLIKEIEEIIKRYDIIKETENYKFELTGVKTAYVYADRLKLNQVIYNLVNNAINYTGKDKLVKINVKKCKDSYLVEIIDTGKGIDEKELDVIWDRYYKNEKNHQRYIVGSGIGLSIVKTILENHHFSYGVKSKKNCGSTFYFYVKRK